MPDPLSKKKYSIKRLFLSKSQTNKKTAKKNQKFQLSHSIQGGVQHRPRDREGGGEPWRVRPGGVERQQGKGPGNRKWVAWPGLSYYVLVVVPYRPSLLGMCNNNPTRHTLCQTYFKHDLLFCCTTSSFFYVRLSPVRATHVREAAVGMEVLQKVSSLGEEGRRQRCQKAPKGNKLVLFFLSRSQKN